MEALNAQERKVAMMKFIFICLATLIFIPLMIVLYQRVPEAPIVENTVPASETIDENLLADIRHRLSTAAENQSKINIMLLVDATLSMEDFLPAVGEAADQITTSYNCSIAAACYRDAEEGHWLYQTSESRSQQAGYWLKKLGTHTRFDKDEPEAMYYGLREALRSEQLKKGETNILILIGDAGNHSQDEKTHVEASEIVQLLKEKNCHFAAFQTRHPIHDLTFDQFSEQIKNEIMAPALQKRQLQKQENQAGTTFYANGATNFQLLALHKNQKIAPQSLIKGIISFVDETVKEVLLRVQATRDLQEGKPSKETNKDLLPVLETYGVTHQDLQYLKTAYTVKTEHELAKQQ